jgi:undecaprenyl-diphosphatase
MMEELESLDQQLFLFLNGLHSEGMDPVMALISSKSIWIPLYLVILFSVYRKYGFKGLAPLVILSFGVMLAFTDLGSVHLFKKVFMRYRPCHNLDLMSMIHIVDGHCGGKYGFISSHAANTFGLATYFSFLMRKRWIWVSMLTWAAVVSYSRIYLGVHYPADILGGLLWGLASGSFLYFLMSKFVLNRLV